MSKRHSFGVDFSSRVRRMQELIMARSGIDEFYEIIRLILAKYFAESEGQVGLPDAATCNRLLAKHGSEVQFILDGTIALQTPPDLFPEIQRTFGDISIRGQDFTALDQAFEQLTSRSYKSDKGQYFTPRHVVDMCVEAIDPKPGELVCDPACGSGAFLKSAHTYSSARYGAPSSLFGFDYSHRACQVAQTVSLIAAGDVIKIMQVDSLRQPTRRLLDDDGLSIETAMGVGFDGFDAIVTNPPFAGDVAAEMFASDYDMAGIYPKRLERDVLFVERCIRLLKEGGRLAMVLPDNKVSSRAFRDLRLWLGKHSQITSVVSLHRYTFLPYTSQKASVVFAIKRPPAMRPYASDVLFFRSDRPGKTSNGTFLYRTGADPNAPPYQSLDHDLGEIASDIREATCAA